MPTWLVILLKIATVFLVILAGWVARRKRLFGPETIATLSRFIVDAALPALVLVQMLRTVNAEALRASWYYPLLGAAVLFLGQLVGHATRPLFAPPEKKQSYVFLVLLSNWLYLPLVIVPGLYGDDGVRTVLLFNVGVQVYFWTVALRVLRGPAAEGEAVREILRNPGLWATAAGILLALLLPEARSLAAEDHAPGRGILEHGLHVVFAAAGMIGQTALPLSLLLTGAQLGGLEASHHRPSRLAGGLVLGRLVLTPVAAVLLCQVLAVMGAPVPEVPRMVFYITVAMPVAVSGSIMAERFGGDTALAAPVILYSTFLSIATVPALVALIRFAGL